MAERSFPTAFDDRLSTKTPSDLSAAPASEISYVNPNIEVADQAANRTIQGRLGQAIYLEDVDGFVGDGSNDDTASVQEAIDRAIATDAKTIVFPHRKTIFVTDRLTFTDDSGIVIYGNYSNIKFNYVGAGSGGDFRFLSSDDATAQGADGLFLTADDTAGRIHIYDLELFLTWAPGARYPAGQTITSSKDAYNQGGYIAAEYTTSGAVYRRYTYASDGAVSRNPVYGTGTGIDIGGATADFAETLTFQGVYKASTTYATGDLVVSNLASMRCIAAGTSTKDQTQFPNARIQNRQLNSSTNVVVDNPVIFNNSYITGNDYKSDDDVDVTNASATVTGNSTTWLANGTGTVTYAASTTVTGSSTTFLDGTETGTVTTTNGSKQVTGSGTTFTSFNKHDKFYVPDDTAIYYVDYVESTTVLYLTEDYAGTGGSGLSFARNPDVEPGDTLYRPGDTASYVVESITSDTSLTLTGAYAGTPGAGANYAINASVLPGQYFYRLDDSSSDIYTISTVDSATQFTLSANYTGVTGSGVDYMVGPVAFLVTGLLIQDGDDGFGFLAHRRVTLQNCTVYNAGDTAYRTVRATSSPESRNDDVSSDNVFINCNAINCFSGFSTTPGGTRNLAKVGGHYEAWASSKIADTSTDAVGRNVKLLGPTYYGLSDQDAFECQNYRLVSGTFTCIGVSGLGTGANLIHGSNEYNKSMDLNISTYNFETGVSIEAESDKKISGNLKVYAENCQLAVDMIGTGSNTGGFENFKLEPNSFVDLIANPTAIHIRSEPVLNNCAWDLRGLDGIIEINSNDFWRIGNDIPSKNVEIIMSSHQLSAGRDVSNAPTLGWHAEGEIIVQTNAAAGSVRKIIAVSTGPGGSSSTWKTLESVSS